MKLFIAGTVAAIVSLAAVGPSVAQGVYVGPNGVGVGVGVGGYGPGYGYGPRARRLDRNDRLYQGRSAVRENRRLQRDRY